MSDYEVTLVNDNMQEFYVRFKGPEESEQCHLYKTCIQPLINYTSTLPRWTLENPRRTPRSVPVQITQHRVCQPHLPPQYRRAVRQRLSRRH